MIKNLIFLLATIGLITNISGCTSKKAQDESEIVENAAVDKIDAESQAGAAAAGTAVTSATDDASLQAALGETSAVTADPGAAAAPALDDPNAAIAAAPDAVTLDGTAPPPADANVAAATEPVTTSPDIAAAPTLDESSLNDIPAPTDANVASMTETPLTSEPPPAVEPKPESTSSLSSSNATLVSCKQVSTIISLTIYTSKILQSSSLKRIY